MLLLYNVQRYIVLRYNGITLYSITLKRKRSYTITIQRVTLYTITIQRVTLYSFTL